VKPLTSLEIRRRLGTTTLAELEARAALAGDSPLIYAERSLADTQELPCPGETMADMVYSRQQPDALAVYDRMARIGRNLDRALQPASEWPERALVRLARDVRGAR
jgi:hypothetical protein